MRTNVWIIVTWDMVVVVFVGVVKVDTGDDGKVMKMKLRDADEIRRYAVQRIKMIAYTRVPNYEQPADSHIEAAVMAILKFMIDREGNKERSMDKFWVVWCPEKGIPKVTHASLDDAKMEARRVAILEGAKVYVMEAVGVAYRGIAPVTWEEV